MKTKAIYLVEKNEQCWERRTPTIRKCWKQNEKIKAKIQLAEKWARNNSKSEGAAFSVLFDQSEFDIK